MKKTFMIFILIVFIIIIVGIFVKINSQSVEKMAGNFQNSTNINNVTTSTVKSTSTIRKSNEKPMADTSNMIDITDNYFIEQTNDVYLNLDDYIGKTVKMQGLIYSYEDSNGDICYAVVRNTPGCCGNDGLAGLDIRYDEEYPEENTWVEVVGVIGKDIVYHEDVPAIQVTTLTEVETGTTFVTN